MRKNDSFLRKVIGCEDESDGELAPAGDAPAQEQSKMPLPSDLPTIFLAGLFILAALAALHAASAILLPVLLAFVLKLLLQPVMRLLERLHVPRAAGALLTILLVVGGLVGLGAALSGPAGTWAAKLPEGIPRLVEHLR